MAEKNNSRREKVLNSMLDAGADGIEELGIEAIHAVLQEVKDWAINKYYKLKSGSGVDTKVALENLEKQIQISNETIDIGMEKKEIAIMWAMRKLGYTEEQTKQVLDLANQAYQRKE